MGLLDGLLGAGTGLAGAIWANDKGVGKNKFNAQNFGDSTQYNPNQFNYGGTPGGADAAANQYYNNGQGAEARQAYQTNYAPAGAYQGLGDTARAGQSQAADLMMRRANGLVPSIAGMQADRDRNAANAAIVSNAAGARGPAALALAQQGAGQSIANAYSNISGQAQINAANERMQAENSAYGAYGGLRQGDLGEQTQLAQQAQFQGTLDQHQRQLNDTYSLGNSNLANSVRTSQLQAGQNEQGLLANSQSAANSLNSGVAGANAGNDLGLWKFGMGAISGGIKAAGQSGPSAEAPASPGKGSGGDSGSGGDGSVGAAAHGGPVTGGRPYVMGELGPELVVPQHGLMARANGGPVSSGQPYLVGERGPEMVVPQQNAVVIPAHQTAGLLAKADQMKAGMQASLDAGPAARRLSDGTPENGYQTELTHGAEAAYQRQYRPGDDADYDLRGAFAGGLLDGQPGVRNREGGLYFPGHLPDTYKKPNHETFSNESQYAQYSPETAGSWGDNDRYVAKGPPAWLRQYMETQTQAARREGQADAVMGLMAMPRGGR